MKFETFGCGSAIASSSMATELIKGKPLSEALELTNQAVTEALDGLPAHKLHCSVLAEEAIQKALEDYYRRQGIPCEETPVTCHTCCAGEDSIRTACPFLYKYKQTAHAAPDGRCAPSAVWREGRPPGTPCGQSRMVWSRQGQASEW